MEVIREHPEIAETILLKLGESLMADTEDNNEESVARGQLSVQQITQASEAIAAGLWVQCFLEILDRIWNSLDMLG